MAKAESVNNGPICLLIERVSLLGSKKKSTSSRFETQNLACTLFKEGDGHYSGRGEGHNYSVLYNRSSTVS